MPISLKDHAEQRNTIIFWRTHQRRFHTHCPMFAQTFLPSLSKLNTCGYTMGKHMFVSFISFIIYFHPSIKIIVSIEKLEKSSLHGKSILTVCIKKYSCLYIGSHVQFQKKMFKIFENEFNLETNSFVFLCFWIFYRIPQCSFHTADLLAFIE